MKKFSFYSTLCGLLCTLCIIPLHGMEMLILDNRTGNGEDIFCYVGHPNYEKDQSLEIPAGCCAEVAIECSAQEAQKPVSIYFQTQDYRASQRSLRNQAERRGVADIGGLGRYMQTCKNVHFKMQQSGAGILITRTMRKDLYIPRGKTLVCTFGKHLASEHNADHFEVSLISVPSYQGTSLYSQLNHSYTRSLHEIDKLEAVKMLAEGKELEPNLPPSE